MRRKKIYIYKIGMGKCILKIKFKTNVMFKGISHSQIFQKKYLLGVEFRMSDSNRNPLISSDHQHTVIHFLQNTKYKIQKYKDKFI